MESKQAYCTSDRGSDHDTDRDSESDTSEQISDHSTDVDSDEFDSEHDAVVAMSLLKFFKGQFNKPDFSDIIFKCGEVEIYAHRILLCSRSKYFNKICGPKSTFKKNNEKVINMNDIEPSIVTAILEYLYDFGDGGPMIISPATCEAYAKLAAAAKTFLLPDLVATSLYMVKFKLDCLANLNQKKLLELIEVFRYLPNYYYLDNKLEHIVKQLRDINLNVLKDNADFQALVKSRPGWLAEQKNGTMGNLAKDLRAVIMLCGNCSLVWQLTTSLATVPCLRCEAPCKVPH